jgi:hypothetical protein
MRILLIALTTALCTAGCGDRRDDINRPLDLLAPLGLESTVVLIDRRAPEALLLDVADDALPDTPVRVALPYAPETIVRRNAADEALVLCRGRRADRSHAAEPAALVALGGNGKSRTYELGNPFGDLIQSEDGRYAFLL